MVRPREQVATQSVGVGVHCQQEGPRHQREEGGRKDSTAQLSARERSCSPAGVPAQLRWRVICAGLLVVLDSGPVVKLLRCVDDALANAGTAPASPLCLTCVTGPTKHGRTEPDRLAVSLHCGCSGSWIES
jgi:hypothetical protein